MYARVNSRACQSASACTHTYGYTGGDAYTHGNPESRLDTESATHTHGHSLSDADPVTNPRTHGNTYSDADGYTYGISHGDAYTLA